MSGRLIIILLYGLFLEGHGLGGPGSAIGPANLTANLVLVSPTVVIVDPEDGEVLSPGGIRIRVLVTEPGAQVLLVYFYVGTNQIGSALEAPFALEWESVPPGRYAVHAKALDETGRWVVSRAVHFQVGEEVEDQVTRGPYLQCGTATSMIIRWRTDWFLDGRVEYGTDPEDLDRAVYDGSLVLDHEFKLEGLLPGTRYFYSISSGGTPLGSGLDYYFVTSPSGAKRTSIWVIGDSGSANANARLVRDAYLDFADGGATDLWLMLGDNAYFEGSDEEYQAAVFDMYPGLLRNTVLWPALGNHDSRTVGVDGMVPYFDNFSLPEEGEAGGLASGTENYYSFDYGNIHFICLDSQSTDRSSGGVMMSWLEADLAATEQDWIIAYWHHPPYTFGTHNSDKEAQLIEMRENALPVLEAHGVDLVLSGHSHVYERSYLLNGHYGFSTNLTRSMILDGGSGQVDEEGAYWKPAACLGEGQGTVYAVCGCSGAGGAANITKHPAMFASLTGFGSMVLEVDGDRLDGRFLYGEEETGDHFTIVKSAEAGLVHPRLRISSLGDEAEISWPTSRMNYVLEARDRSSGGGGWEAVTNAPSEFGRRHLLKLEAEEELRLFRLRLEAGQ